MTAKKYIIRAADYYVAAKRAAEMDLSLRDWEFMYDGDMFEGYRKYADPIVYVRLEGESE